MGYKNRAQYLVISRAPGAPPVAPAADVESVESIEAWDDSRWARQATSVNHTFDEDDQKQVRQTPSSTAHSPLLTTRGQGLVHGDFDHERPSNPLR